MTESQASSEGGRGAAKRIKVAGSTSYGNAPNEFSGYKETMYFHLHNFANLKQKRGECINTDTIKAHGHLWKLQIYPRGDTESKTDVEYISLDLMYAGENTKTDPVLAKAMFRTKTTNRQLEKDKYYKENAWELCHFTKRGDILTNDCNDAGTLTITVVLEVATEKKSVWFPQLNYCDNIIGTQLFSSTDTADVSFIVGTSNKEFVGHKCIISLRARSLYDLILTEEQSSNGDGGGDGNDDERNAIKIILPDADEFVFETLLKFIYTDIVPKLEKDDDDDNDNEEKVKSILLAADRFGCTDSINGCWIIIACRFTFMCIIKGSYYEHVCFKFKGCDGIIQRRLDET